jgi:hypothetical protein
MCRLDRERNAHRLLVVVLAGISALTWVAVSGAGRGGADPFLALWTRLLAIVSLVATLWLLLPLAALTC